MHNVQISRMQLDKVMESLEDILAGSYEEARVSPGYSGRGMYGATCIGVEHGRGIAAPAAFLFLVAEILGLDFIDFLIEVGGGETDSMGLGVITYWRGLTLLDEA